MQRDIVQAISLLKTMSEDDRDKAAVYMDGLSQMRSEWGVRGSKPAGRQKNSP